MKWLKHQTDSRNDLDVQIILEEYGAEGFGVFWLCLELVASQGENYQIKKQKDWLKYISKLSKIDQKRTEEILHRLASIGLVDKKSLNRGHLHVPKMSKYADEYNHKKKKTGDFVPLEEKRRDKKRTEEKRVEKKPEASISFLEKIPVEVMDSLYEKYNSSKEDIQGKADDLVNYCRAKGKKYNNYKAFLENALKRDFGLLTDTTRKERERNLEIQESVARIKKIDSSPGTGKVEDIPGYKSFSFKASNL